MKEKTNIIVDYLDKVKNIPLGCSDYALLIEMINKEEKIIDLSTFEEYRHTLLGFLDSGLMELLKNKHNKENFYDSVITVLKVWDNLPNKWEISGYEFRKLFREKEID